MRPPADETAPDGPAADDETLYDVLISDGPGEIRWALLRNGRVLEVVHDRPHRPETGAVLLGRCSAKVPGHKAVFVDLGRGIPGFLSAEDAPDGLPTEGATVVVQVLREALAEKGPKLTAAPSLAGGLLAYTPSRPGLGMSPRITANDDRKRLKTLLQGAMVADEGVVVRTAAAEAPEDHVRAELQALRESWHALSERADAARHPCLLHPAPSPLEDWVETLGWRLRTIIADSGARMTQAHRLMAARLPDWPGRVMLDPGTQGPLFDVYGVEEALDSLLLPRVPLPGGGALIIEETAALTAIDVDSGAGDPRTLAREAVPEVARQIRLRGLAGQILVDLPRGRKGPDRGALDLLRDAMADDPAGGRVLGTTPGGLVEINRPRRRTPASSILTAASARPRLSPETALLAALRLLLRGQRHAPGKRPYMRMGPRCGALMQGDLAPALTDAELRLAQSITIQVDDAQSEDHVVVDYL